MGSALTTPVWLVVASLSVACVVLVLASVACFLLMARLHGFYMRAIRDVATINGYISRSRPPSLVAEPPPFLGEVHSDADNRRAAARQRAEARKLGKANGVRDDADGETILVGVTPHVDPS